MSEYIVCYDDKGDVTYSLVRIADDVLPSVLSHECVLFVCNKETGEVLMETTPGASRLLDMSLLKEYIDVKDLLDLKWLTVEEMSLRE